MGTWERPERADESGWHYHLNARGESVGGVYFAPPGDDHVAVVFPGVRRVEVSLRAGTCEIVMPEDVIALETIADVAREAFLLAVERAELQREAEAKAATAAER